MSRTRGCGFLKCELRVAKCDLRVGSIMHLKCELRVAFYGMLQMP